MNRVLPDPLVVMALEQEAGDLFERAAIPVLYTGVGKINATYHLALELAGYRAQGRNLPLVLNFGTAGSRQFETGTLVACSSFVQRDMDASALGFEVCSTPYDRTPAVLAFPPIDPELPQGICGSGDSFVTACPVTHFNVMDMEAYAYAKVCWLQGARFGAIKYITDGADHNAADSWKANLNLAAERFLEAYLRLTRSAGI